MAAFIDAEHALDVAYARGIGVATEKLLVSQPDTGEQALDITEMLVRSGAVDLVVIDSVAALTPKAELEGDMGDAHMGLQARLMSQALRKLTAAAYRGGTTLMFLNQLRQKIGVTFGSPETTTGGNALKFYASMRFDVRRIGQVKVGDEPVGGRTRVKVAKNKCAPPFCEAEFEIRWGVGVDSMTELLDLGIARGLVDKAGNHLSFAGSPLGNGRERSRDTLAGSADLQTRCVRRSSRRVRCGPGGGSRRRREPSPGGGGAMRTGAASRPAPLSCLLSGATECSARTASCRAWPTRRSAPTCPGSGFRTGSSPSSTRATTRTAPERW